MDINFAVLIPAELDIDYPFVFAQTIQQLIDAYKSKEKSTNIIYPAYQESSDQSPLISKVRCLIPDSGLKLLNKSEAKIVCCLPK